MCAHMRGELDSVLHYIGLGETTSRPTLGALRLS